MTLRKAIATGLRLCRPVRRRGRRRRRGAGSVAHGEPPESSPTPVCHRLLRGPPTPTASGRRPGSTPATTPDVTSTPTQTADPTVTAPTPFPSPVETVVARTPTTATSTASPRGPGHRAAPKRKRGNTKAGRGKLDNGAS